MLFEVDTDEVSAPVQPPVSQRPKPEPRTLHVPAQEWEEWSAIVCCAKMAESKPGEVVGVPVVEHGGYLHCAFSAMYGGRSGNNVVDAWQLIPADLYEGQTWTYHPLDFSVRERGDYTGLRVSVRGSHVVCTKPVSVVRTYPTIRPISMQDALKYDDSARSYGWRAMGFRGAKRSWKLLHGHPVAVYHGADEVEDGSTAVLLWKYKWRILDYYLGSPELLENLQDFSETSVSSVRTEVLCKPQTVPLQAALF